MLEIKEMFKNYGNHQVLTGVTFSLKPGELKGLIGVNGSGKTTMIECICGIKPFEKGEIIVAGLDVKNKKNCEKIKKIFGYMPQSYTMFGDLTVRENLSYIASVYNLHQERVDEIINICCLTSYSNVLANKLSGGYKQLLSLAGAIIHNPKLLILDEPTSAMDPIFRNKFWEIIHDYHNHGASVLLITHYVEEVNECENFMCLADGKIVYDGKVGAFMKNGFVDMQEIMKTYSGGKNEKFL